MFKKIFSNILVMSLSFLYLLFIFVLYILNILSLKDFINYSVIFIGWLVALSLVWIQLRERVKKSLEIDAFKEINKTIANFYGILSKILVSYLGMPNDLKLHMKSPDTFKFNLKDINLNIDKNKIELLKGITDFVYAIEANEITVLKFDHLRKYIQFKVDDIVKLIRDFQNFLVNTNISGLKTNKNQQFKKWCKRIYNELVDIAAYLFDYRIELMNYFLGDIFHTKVPHRKPRDPRYKTLTEIAIKEEVEKEAERRERRVLKSKNIF